MSRKFRIIVLLALVVAICGAAAAPSPQERTFKNLKVLPKDIDSKSLQKIMVDDFNDELGVGCGFCHAEEKGSHRLDYASDAKPEKEIARTMMRMTIKVNKQFFQLRHPMIGDPSLVITCNTCHRGQPHPDTDAIAP
jgi:hypothetical protein